MLAINASLRRLRSELASFVWRSPLAPMADGYRCNRELRTWVRGAGKGAAPALVKRALLRSLGAAHRLSTFVETGTCLGGTTYALRNDFETIISMELDPILWANAARRLRPFPQISIRRGDSAELLPEIVKELSGAALFFLDGHYSSGVTARGDKDTPIVEELRSVLSDDRFEHVVVIDDARCFTGDHDYPTIDQLRSFVQAQAPRYGFYRHTDMIVLEVGRPQPGFAAE